MSLTRRIERGTYLLRQDEIQPWLSGTLDTQHSSRGGVRGLATSQRTGQDLRVTLTKTDGFYKALVQKPAVDVWTGGWEPDATTTQLRDELMQWDASVRVWPSTMGMQEAGRRCLQLARRDNRSLLLLRLRDAATSPADEPRNVTDILQLKPVPHRLIKRIVLDTRIDSPRYDQPIAYDIYARPGDEASVVRVHWERVIPFIHEPNDDEPHKLEGESVLDALLLGAGALLNIKWAMSEAYHKFGSPYFVATVDKEFEVEEDDPMVKQLDERLANLATGAVDNIRLHGATIALLHADPSDPAPFVKIHREDAAAASGIPLRELTGSEAGALQAAQWDSRRYDQSVVSPTRSSVGTPALLEWWARLRKWGLVQAAGMVRGVTWYPYVQVDERERAPQQLQIAATLEKYQRLRLPVPKEVQALITIEGTDLNQPLPLPPASPDNASMVDSSQARAGDTHHDAREFPLDILARLEQRAEDALRKAWRAWHAQIEQAAQASGVRLTVSGDANEAGLAAALLALNLQADDLQAAIEAILIEAAQRGILRDVDVVGERAIRDFLSTPRAPVLRQYARTYSARKAERASQAVRDVVARIMAQGGSAREVQAELRRIFTGLENTAAIARTEVARGYNAGVFAQLEAAGGTQWEYLAYPGADEECAQHDGHVYPIDGGPSLPLHPLCRCTAKPVFEGGLLR